MSNRRRSCDACYKRKIRCVPSNTRNLCDWCAHHKLVCVFSPRKPRKNKNNESAEKLAKRLEAVENELHQIKASRSTGQKPLSPVTTVPTPQSAIQSPLSTDSRRCTLCRAQCAPPKTARCPDNASLGQIFFAGHNYGILCTRTGIPHFSAHCEEWIHAQTGQWPRFHFPPFRESKPSWVSLSPADLAELPERWIVDSLFDDYIRSDFYLIFPVLDLVLFRDTINTAYADSDISSLDSISAKANVFAFTAMACIRFPSNKASSHVDAENYSKRAQIMLSECFEDASLTALQTFLSLLLFEINAGRMQAVVMYHAVACRTVISLGGQVTALPVATGRPFTISEREDRHLRMLFWLCYVLDRDISLRCGHPPVINDRFCDLTLPEGWAETRNGTRQNDLNCDDQMPFFPGDLRLCMLKSKVMDLLFANASLGKSDAEILRTIRELDEELDEWRSSLPPKYAPSMSIKKGTKLSDELTEAASMLHIELHLEYHHLLNAIHCASGRCTAPGGGAGGPINSGVQSSLDVSVEASRSTLIYLTSASSRIACEAFWVFVFYPMSALTTVFFSILRDPDNEHAIEDVELLATSSRIIHNMPIYNMSQHKVDYLAQVDVFVAELCRLACSAIQLSRQGQAML